MKNKKTKTKTKETTGNTTEAIREKKMNENKLK